VASSEHDSCFSSGVRVRLTKLPDEPVNGHDWRGYQIGRVYDLPPEIADYLVVAGYAVVEMRGDRRLAAPERRDPKR
jgi:hypothetical protein